jgi:hypothetical protein
MMCPLCDAFVDDDDVWCPECDAFLDEEFMDDESYNDDEREDY